MNVVKNSLLECDHFVLTEMSNINVLKCSSCLDFIGDYEIKSIEVKTGDELNGDLMIVILIENEEYELRVSMKEGKKELV